MNRSTLFKVVCAIPFAFLIGILVSAVIDRVVDPPFEGPQMDFQLPEYRPILTTHDGVLLAESRLGLRLCFDPFTIYRNLPNQHTRSFSIDERGFRLDGDLVEAPRTFVLGGSAAFGQGLKPGELPFSARLQKVAPALQCANAAVVGFLSSQELAMMVHRIDEFQPRLYIVFDGWNDLFDPFSRVKKWPTAKAQIGISSLFRMIESRLLEFQRTEMGTSAQPEDVGGHVSPVELDREAFFDQVIDDYAMNVERMHSFARSRGADFLVVFQPELGLKTHKSMHEESHIEYANRTYSQTKGGFSELYVRLVESAKQRCVDQGIQYVDLATEGPFVTTKAELFSDTVHLNDLGHELVTVSILEAIERGSHPSLER